MLMGGYKSKDFDRVLDWIQKDKDRYMYIYNASPNDLEGRDCWQRCVALNRLEDKIKNYCRNTPNEPDRNIGS